MHILIPDCSYCEKPLDGVTVNGLHRNCDQRLHAELVEWEESVKYSGVLNWRDSEGHCGTLGEFKDIEARDKTEAEKIVLDEFWDNRLNSASCVPVVIFE